jgi:predicted nucleic acid-binding Zn ribbon protein
MLTPRYRNITESVSDFNDLLEDMNKTSPLEHHKADQEVRARQDEERLKRELQHVENVIAGSGHFFTDREKSEWYQKRDTIAEMLGMETSPIEESYNALGGDPAINSRYQSGDSALERFRVLSGIEEQTAMPRDAGIFGSTRHNQNYDEIAGESLSEARDREDVHESSSILALSRVRKGAKRAEKRNPNGIAIRPEDDVPEKRPGVEKGRSHPTSRGNLGSRHGEWKNGSPKKESSNRFRGIARSRR